MTVAVIGGTGSIGAPVVAELARQGVPVRIVSRHGAPLDNAEFRPADLRTGAGLAGALEGCATVVNAVSGARATMIDGLHRLLDAERHAGVRHHVEISIVGIDRAPMRYYQLKLEQEQIVADGPVPWTLLRATQFHTLVRTLLDAAARMRTRPSGPIRVQPIAPESVATRLAELARADPAGRVPDIAGPQVETLTGLGRAYARQRGMRLVPLPMVVPGRFGRALRAGALCAPDAAAPGPTFAEWLASKR